ncbi:MAG: hypothetical protein JWL77_6999, partial [Chthonomonadaceae bacterium]|nr:hypothetical protein [Chthonomonadaceae bacterium]
ELQSNGTNSDFCASSDHECEISKSCYPNIPDGAVSCAGPYSCEQHQPDRSNSWLFPQYLATTGKDTSLGFGDHHLATCSTGMPNVNRTPPSLETLSLGSQCTGWSNKLTTGTPNGPCLVRYTEEIGPNGTKNRSFSDPITTKTRDKTTDLVSSELSSPKKTSRMARELNYHKNSSHRAARSKQSKCHYGENGHLTDPMGVPYPYPILVNMGSKASQLGPLVSPIHPKTLMDRLRKKIFFLPMCQIGLVPKVVACVRQTWP